MRAEGRDGLGLGERGARTGQKGAEARPEQSPAQLTRARGSHSPLRAGAQVDASLRLCTADGRAD